MQSLCSVQTHYLLGEIQDASAQGLRFQNFDGPAETEEAFAGVLERLEGKLKGDPSLGVWFGARDLVTNRRTESVRKVGDKRWGDACGDGIVGAAFLECGAPRLPESGKISFVSSRYEFVTISLILVAAL